ncbi:MAG: hypothetical protein AAF436_07375 [Myxococcota bacterium]
MFESKLPLERYIDLKGPCFENAYKPIYIMRFPAEFDRDVMVAAYEELVRATRNVIGPFAMLVDITAIRAGNAEGRQLAASYADRLEAAVTDGDYLVGLAIVAAKSWQRGLFTAVTWLRRGTSDYPTKTFGGERDAIAWLHEELDSRLRADEAKRHHATPTPGA